MMNCFIEDKIRKRQIGSLRSEQVLKIERRNLGASAGRQAAVGPLSWMPPNFPECGEDTEAHAGRQGGTKGL